MTAPLAKRLAMAAAPPVRRLVEQRDALIDERAQLTGQLRDLRRQLRRNATLLGLGDDLGYLFVLTYGRSGSTLLQGLLNTIPGYLVRGENEGVLYSYYRAHRILASKRDTVGGMVARNQERDAWYGIDGYDDATAYGAVRALMLRTLIRPRPASRVVGFKEIRYNHEDLEDYVSFMQQVFPGARFLVNTRDLDDVAQSKWWARDPDARDVLARCERGLLALVQRLGPAAQHVHYDTYVERPATLRSLFDWLGEEYDESRVRAVLATRYSY